MRLNVMKIIMVSSLALVLATGYVGCGGPSTGHLNLAVNDAPVDSAVELVVTFVSVSLKGLDGAADQGPVIIPEEDQVVNLMDYHGTDHAVLVKGLELPVGNYKVRLDADLTFNEEEQKSWIAFDAESLECLESPAGVVWADDLLTCRYPLEIPSEEESGFKPKGDVTILADGTSSFTVEFDLRKNVVNPLDEGLSYKLKPTGLRLVNDAVVGSIAGVVDGDFLASECGEAQALVYLFDRTDAVDEFIPDDIHAGNDSYVTSVAVMNETVDDVTIYHYLIGFILPGEYGVALTCEEDSPDVDDELFFLARVDDITVSASEQTIQDLPATE